MRHMFHKYFPDRPQDVLDTKEGGGGARFSKCSYTGEGEGGVFQFFSHSELGGGWGGGGNKGE